MTKNLSGKTLATKVVIAITSMAMTLGGWAAFASQEPKVAAQSVPVAASPTPTAQAAAYVGIGPVAPKKMTKLTSRTAAAKPAKVLRVVTAPMPAPAPPVIIAITRSSS